MTASTTLAPVKRTRTVSNSVAFGNAIMSFLLEGEDTGGRLSLIEIEGRPGTEPPYHVHEMEDEIFYLLEGRVSVMVDGVVHELSAGDTIFLPRGIPHTFRIRSESAHSLLILTSSGFENYFRMLGRDVSSLDVPDNATPRPEHLGRLASASALFNVRILPDQPAF